MSGEEENRQTLARIAAGARSGALSILVMSESATTTVPLPEQGEVIIGRGEECAVRLEDARLSRRHAALRVGERVEFVDLGSRNGSFIRNQRLEPNVPVELVVGEAVTLGSSVVVLQGATSAARPRHVWSHGYFEARLEEECSRAALGGATFAVLRVRVAGATMSSKTEDSDHAAMSVANQLVNGLRVTDILATYSPGDYEVLLTKTNADEAAKVIESLRAKLVAVGADPRMALAVHPRDGRTPEALIERTNTLLRDAPDARVGDDAVVATGALERMDRLLDRVAAGVINVLILGETGVGKEVLARRIHERSPRKAKPMVSINCAALSESLLESELFGHEKGAFTGAVAAKPGLLEAAEGGTVFLDEVGEMPLALQAKLLRALEQREVTRVGALKPRPIDVRFVAATNRDLESEIAAARFRQDLYFRLNGIALTLPPLRERVDEIEPLARAFVVEACKRAGRPPDMRIDPNAMALLQQYQWPGNIRELRNVIERAVLLCSGSVITRAHLPVEKMGLVLTAPPERRAPVAVAPVFAGSASATLPPTVPDWAEVTRQRQAQELAEAEAERGRVLDALEKCGGNQSQAAKLLGVSRGTLIKRLEAFKVPRPRKKE